MEAITNTGACHSIKRQDEIYDNVDAWMKDDQIEIIDHQLKITFFKSKNIDELMTWLTACLPVKSRLDWFKPVYYLCYNLLDKNKENAKHIMQGLEPYDF